AMGVFPFRSMEITSSALSSSRLASTSSSIEEDWLRAASPSGEEAVSGEPACLAPDLFWTLRSVDCLLRNTLLGLANGRLHHAAGKPCCPIRIGGQALEFNDGFLSRP